MREAILNAHARVDVPSEAARDWFLSLEEHPERYTFNTHQGFEFESGSFGEVGARFRTQETFFFLQLQLPFELMGVSERSFSFRLLRPRWIEIWGRFEIEEAGHEETLLSLRIGSDSRVGQLILRCYPIAAAIHQQICRETNHIRRSMEDAYSASS